MWRRRQGIAGAVLVLALIAAAVAVGQYPGRTPSPAPPRKAPLRSAPAETAESDTGLEVTAQDFQRVMSAAESLSADFAAPLSEPYWDDSSPRVMVEPTPARKLVDAEEDVIWHAWTLDGKSIIYATQRGVFVYERRSGGSSVIMRSEGIDNVCLSPDRQKLAVIAGNVLSLLDVRGRPLGSHRTESAILSADWSPDSYWLAFTTRSRVWITAPGKPLRQAAHHPWFVDTYQDSPAQVKVVRIDAVSWSASGRDLAYVAHTVPEVDFGKPYIVTLNTKTGRTRVVLEGYSEADRYYCWTSVDDWMVTAGNMGEADALLSLRQVWNDVQIPVYYGGTTPPAEPSWQPCGSGFACRWELWHERVLVVRPEYAVGVQRLVGDDVHIQGEVDRKQVTDLAARAASSQFHRAESGVPDFDWSTDGAKYACINHYYTFRQEDEHTGSTKTDTGDRLSILEVQSAEGSQQILTADDQPSRQPRFSPDGTQVTRIRGGDIWASELITAPRSESEAARWFDTGRKLRSDGDLVGAALALRNAVRHSPRKEEPHLALSDLYRQLARREANPYRKYLLLDAALFEARQGGGQESERVRDLRGYVRSIESVAQGEIRASRQKLPGG